MYRHSKPSHWLHCKLICKLYLNKAEENLKDLAFLKWPSWLWPVCNKSSRVKSKFLRMLHILLIYSLPVSLLLHSPMLTVFRDCEFRDHILLYITLSYTCPFHFLEYSPPQGNLPSLFLSLLFQSFI